MWGESFPVSTYEALGFRKAASFQGDIGALKDMLSGAHGQEVQKLVTKSMAAGMNRDAANELCLVEFAIADRSAARSLAFGLRHDRMKWVKDDKSLQGALVRTFVLKNPGAGDAQLLRAKVAEIAVKQREDGSFGDTAKATGEALLELLRLGASRDEPVVGKAVEAIIRQHRAGKTAKEWFQKEGCMDLYAAHALCLAGRTDVPEVVTSFRYLAEHPEQYIGMGKGCPWTPAVFLKALWDARGVVDTAAALEKGLGWIRDNMNSAGFAGWKEPFGLVDCAGYIDHPTAREVVLKQVPMLLRAQRPDGGWGEQSAVVFGALHRHGLLDAIGKLPPLPADWRVVRSIPAPEGKLNSLVWDGHRLWTLDTASNTAKAVSPDDGRLLATVAMPKGSSPALGWWNGGLLTVQNGPPRLFQVDPANGEVRRQFGLKGIVHAVCATEVGGKIWVADGWLFPGAILDPIKPDSDLSPDAGPDHRLEPRLAGALPTGLAPTDNGVWHTDFWAPVLVKSGPSGQLLDWGEKPFPGLSGIAWDGRNLWALDSQPKRICVIEKALAGPGEERPER
jgi:hypothetical protein